LSGSASAETINLACAASAQAITISIFDILSIARKVLPGHVIGDITSHYSAPDLHESIEALNRVCAGDSGTDREQNKTVRSRFI
jgi:hypothetical protein